MSAWERAFATPAWYLAAGATHGAGHALPDRHGRLIRSGIATQAPTHDDGGGGDGERPRAEREALAWLDTVGPETVATFAGELGRTIVPAPAAHPSTGGVRALGLVEQLASEALPPSHLRLGALIGQGGMGEIREAEQVALGRTVAVKTLRADRRDPGAALDLLREAWVTGALEHPNVVPVHYLGVDDGGRPSIVLKRIEGVEWSRLVHDAAEVERRFGATDLLAWNVGILVQVLHALRFAHAKGILHRDLKPSNVMIGDYGEVYLLDWGIAVALDDDGTGRFPLAANARQLAGTPCYMAPEMLGRDDGPPLSRRTDVYLAGAVLYELVTGKPPHAGSSSLAVIASVIASRPELPAHVPPELARICTRAMAEDPAARFESADALQLALQRYLEHRGSAQLAARARARLGELLDHLRAPADRPHDDIYRLYGACRYGFRDALAVWPDNDDARGGLEQAVVAVAEYELAAGRPQAAVTLLGELDAPHPLLAAARAAAADEARRVAELELLGRQHDRAIGTRTRMFLMLVFGLMFTIMPLVIEAVPALRNVGYAGHALWAVAFMGAFAAAGWWARESVLATVINRRLLQSAMFLFVAQAVLAIGGALAHRPPGELFVWNLVIYVVLSGQLAIHLDAWLAPSVAGYVAGFLVASRAPELVLYVYSACNGLFMVNAVWRWWPASFRYTDEERAARAARVTAAAARRARTGSAR